MAGEVINTAGNPGKNHARKEVGYLNALNEVMERIKKKCSNGIVNTSTH